MALTTWKKHMFKTGRQVLSARFILDRRGQVSTLGPVQTFNQPTVAPINCVA